MPSNASTMFTDMLFPIMALKRLAETEGGNWIRSVSMAVVPKRRPCVDTSSGLRAGARQGTVWERTAAAQVIARKL